MSGSSKNRPHLSAGPDKRTRPAVCGRAGPVSEGVRAVGGGTLWVRTAAHLRHPSDNLESGRSAATRASGHQPHLPALPVPGPRRIRRVVVAVPDEVAALTQGAQVFRATVHRVVVEVRDGQDDAHGPRDEPGPTAYVRHQVIRLKRNEPSIPDPETLQVVGNAAELAALACTRAHEQGYLSPIRRVAAAIHRHAVTSARGARSPCTRGPRTSPGP